MEVQLLRGRFPSSPFLENCGNIHSFFCARVIGTHSYEGRLLLTNKALFFVSTYSDATAYDVAISTSVIQKVVAVHRTVIPSIELTLGESQEIFTNFREINVPVSTLQAIFPASVQFETRKEGGANNGSRREAKLNRFLSSSGASRSRQLSPPLQQSSSVGDATVKTVPQCPFYSRSGYCPRRIFCNFAHDNPPSGSNGALIQQGAYDYARSISSPGPQYTADSRQLVTESRSLTTQTQETVTPLTHEEGESSTQEKLPIQETADNPDNQLRRRKLAAADVLELVGASDDDEDVEVKSKPRSHIQQEWGVDAEDVERILLEAETASLQDDLDLEAQRELLESFSAEGGPEKTHPPPLPPLPGSRQKLGSSSNSEEEEEPVLLPPHLLVHPARTIGRADIDSGDKVILSQDILIACEQRELSYPMAFCFQNESSGKLVHAGVLEFTSSEPNVAFLPQWMFDHLEVVEGGEVKFEYVDLPKGTFVQLQPVSSAWLSLQYDKRMAVMEFQLRNFQTLTEATKITLTYELNRYTFKVLQCKPAKGISIVDADLTTDIVEPADFNRFHSVEEWQAEHIHLDEPLTCSLLYNTYRHFVLLALPGQPLPSRLRVEVRRLNGDPDLFLSQTCTTPSQKRYTWCNQDQLDSVILLSSSDDKDYSTTQSLFAGVVSLCEDTKFVITFTSECSEELDAVATGGKNESGAGHVLRSATGSSSVSSTGEEGGDGMDEKDETPVPPGHEKCLYCGSIMSSLRLLMHERHCAQSTFKCPVCKLCFPKSIEKKHHYLAHELLQCDCGIEMTQLALHHHQLTDCGKRTTKCPFRWCNLSVPLDQLEHHERQCGRKSVQCPLCSEDVTQLELEIHLEAFHCVEVSKIDWSKPLTPQSLSFKPPEPQFKCHCGSGFQFEDDLQVHQLTECTQSESDETDLIVG